MKIGNLVKDQQSEVHKKLKNKPRKKRRRGKDSLSFSDFEDMMKHDSYRKGKGVAIRRVR